MKKFLLFALLITFGLSTFAQSRAVLPKSKRDVAKKMRAKPIKDIGASTSVYAPGTKSANLFTEEQIGMTIYDLQTNSSTENRVYMFDDGTIGATWNMGFSPSAYSMRGTGYNYFDGNEWGEEPVERIENTKTGWPSYFPYGENGEMFVTHHMTEGLLYGWREEKGTGEWDADNIQAGPPSAVDISWPRGTSTGINNDVIHFISVTYVAYNGQDNALLYSRSQDGGTTWDIENHFFEELGPTYYTNIGGDVYEFAEPKDGKLAFLVGDAWTDLVLMKSEDDGDNWTKTVVWENPYPLNTGGNTDTFYCVDGSHDLAFDNSGKIHIVFGINRAYDDGAGPYWFPGVDGVGYWNEDMPTFSNNVDALNPYGEAGTELVEDYNLIAWSQDLDGNGELDLLDDWGTYYLGLSSMVQLIIDDQDQLFLLYSSVTEGFDNGSQNYRHVWTRTSPDGGTSWGTFYDLNGELIYIFDECVYPSVAKHSDDNIYYTYQSDTEPGLSVQGDEDPAGDNFIRFVSVFKPDIINSVKETKVVRNENVSQNYPNPFSGTSTVYVMLDEPATLSFEVTNLMGQIVYTTAERRYSSGKVEFTIDGSELTSGVYFYTVNSGDSKVTRKMVIE